MKVIYRFFDKIVEVIKDKLTVEKFESLEESSGAMTNQTSLISLFFVIASAVALYGKFEADEILQAGFLAVLGLTVLGYVGDKFLEGCKNISENNLIKVSTSAYTDLGGLFFGLLTVLSIGAAILGGLDEQFEMVGVSIVFAIFMYMTTWLIINPSLLGLRVEKSTSLAQEAISLCLIPSKVSLRSMKVLTAWLLSLGNIAIFFGAAMAMMKEDFEAMQMLGLVTLGYGMVTVAMVLPLIGYFSYMVLSLIFDGLRNILMISEINNKLDLTNMGAVEKLTTNNNPEIKPDAQEKMKVLLAEQRLQRSRMSNNEKASTESTADAGQDSKTEPDADIEENTEE